jgi:hypothetical protein
VAGYLKIFQLVYITAWEKLYLLTLWLNFQKQEDEEENSNISFIKSSFDLKLF